MFTKHYLIIYSLYINEQGLLNIQNKPGAQKQNDNYVTNIYVEKKLFYQSEINVLPTEMRDHETILSGRKA